MKITYCNKDAFLRDVWEFMHDKTDIAVDVHNQIITIYDICASDLTGAIDRYNGEVSKIS